MLKEERHLQQANAPDVDFEAKFMDAGEYAMLEAQASKREEALTVRTPAAQNAVLVNVKKAEDVTQAERRAMPEALVVQMLAAQNSMLEAQASQREEEMPEALVGQMLAAQHTMLEAQASMREEETPEALVGEMLAAQNVMLEAQAERREMPEALVVQMLAAQNAMLEEQASQREEEIPAALVGQTLAAQNAMLEAQAFKREEQTPEALVGQMLAEDVVKPGEEEVFSPTHTTANLCTGKVRAAGLHIKGMDKNNVDLVLGSAAAAVEAEDLDDLVVVTAKEVDVDAVVVSEAAAPQGSAGEAAEADLVLGSAAAAVEVEDLDDPVVVAAKEVDVDDVVITVAAAVQGSAVEAAEADLVLGSAAAAVEAEDLDALVVAGEQLEEELAGVQIQVTSLKEAVGIQAAAAPQGGLQVAQLAQVFEESTVGYDQQRILGAGCRRYAGMRCKLGEDGEAQGAAEQRAVSRRAVGPGYLLSQGVAHEGKKCVTAAAATATAAAEGRNPKPTKVQAPAGTGKQGNRPDQGFWAQVKTLHAHLLDARVPISESEDDTSSVSSLGAATAAPRSGRSTRGGRRR